MRKQTPLVFAIVIFLAFWFISPSNANTKQVLCFTDFGNRTSPTHFFVSAGSCPKNSTHETTKFDSLTIIANYLDEVSKAEFNLGLQNGLSAGYGAGSAQNR